MCGCQWHPVVIIAGITSEHLVLFLENRFLSCAGKNSRLSHSKVKAGLFRERHIPQTERSLSQKGDGPGGVGVLGFYGPG